MRNSKKLLAIMLAVALAAGTAGCGDSGQTDSQKDTQGSGTQSGAQGEDGQSKETNDEDREPVTITFGGWGDYFLLREQCDRFQDKYPWITVDVVKQVGKDWYTGDLAELAATGELPDVFNIENLPVAMQNGWCLDITEYFNEDPLSKTYPEWMVPYCTWTDDKMYTLVSTMYVDLLEVNIDLLEDNNLEIPSYDWTMDEWTAVLRGTAVPGSSIGTTHLAAYLSWLPAQFGNEDIGWYSYNTKTERFELGEEFVQSLNLLKELYDDSVSLYDSMDVSIGLIGGGGNDEANQKIEEERAEYMMDNYGMTSDFWFKGAQGCMATASWNLNWETYNANVYSGFQWDIYPYPSAKAGEQSRTAMANEFLAVSAACEHPYEAYLLMKFMSYDLDGFEAKVDIMANYDKEAYIEKYSDYDPASFATTLFIYQIPPSTDERAVELFARINPNLDKEGLKIIFDRMNDGGFLNGLRVIPGMWEVENLLNWCAYLVFTGEYTAESVLEEGVEDMCNEILDRYRASYGME